MKGNISIKSEISGFIKMTIMMITLNRQQQ